MGLDLFFSVLLLVFLCSAAKIGDCCGENTGTYHLLIQKKKEGHLRSDLRSPFTPLVSARILVHGLFYVLKLVSGSTCARRFEERFTMEKTVGPCFLPLSAVDGDDNVG